MPRKARWKGLLEEYPGFRRWHDNLSRGSRITADENTRVLYRFMDMHDMTPTSLVEQAKKDTRGFEDFLFDFVTRLEKEGKTPSYIKSYLKTVKSWLKFNSITLVRMINVGNTGRTPTIEDERIPVKDELRQILSYAKPRGKVSICLMAFSGLRPQVLADYTGEDGLKIGDLPELSVEANEVNFEKIPTMIVIRPELSKAKHRYLSFLGSEGCQYLKSYLEKRVSEGEELSSGTAIIAYKGGYSDTGFQGDSARSNNHITTKTLTKEIRDAMRPKYTWRPYVLRAYFDTQLLIAENNGKVAHAYRQFFMGHKGDIEARYTTNKGRLPQDFIEDMRSAYQKSLEYLETRKADVGEDKLRESMRRQLLLVAGFSEDEIEGLDSNMSDEEFQESVRKKLFGTVMNNGNPQKVIEMDEIADYLNQGWSFVATIGNEKAIVKLN